MLETMPPYLQPSSSTRPMAAHRTEGINRRPSAQGDARAQGPARVSGQLMMGVSASLQELGNR